MPHPRLTPLILVAVGAALIWPSAAAAQWRRPYPYPYPYGPGVELTGAVRMQVSPRSAEVFVDGYLAGVVDQFDGIFQRLRLPVGGHRLTIYLEGYRTLDRDVYLAPGGDLHIKLAMEPLPPGETAEPPPAPEEVVVPEPPMGEAAGRQPLEPAPAAPRQFYGALSLRVTPPDAAILVDGAPPEIIRRDGVVVIRLSAGEHDLAVSREGYQTYAEKVLIQRGRTLSLSVTLKHEAWLRFGRDEARLRLFTGACRAGSC